MKNNEIIGMLICVAILVMVFLILFYTANAEYLGVPFFLDQMTMEYSDPAKFNFTGRERDVSGMSGRDYYLENQMNYATKVGPQYSKGDLQFVDQTGYMDMPIKYRPLRNPSASSAQLQSQLISNDMEEHAYQDLNQTGNF